jgi:serine/threonine-protein kinase
VPRRWLLAAVTLNLILLAAVLALWQRPASIPGTSRQSVLLWRYQLPPPLEPGVPYVATQAAIAPNGLSIVYSDSTATGIVLMRKLRDAVAATPIAGTEGGISPFFSPDGKWVGYITLDGRLRKVPVAGGGSVTLAEDAISDYRVAAWLDDQTILYTDKTQGVARLPADGGSVVRLRVKEQLGGAAVSVASLWALPGASGCLLTVCRGNCAIEANLYVYDFTADSARLLVPRAAGGWYSPTGHLLYTSRDGGLYAVPFDLRRLVLRPGAVPVIEGVEPLRFTLSASGTALYSTDPSASSPSELVWVTRDGRIAPFDSTWRARFEYPALSPDGSALAVSVRGRTTDLWVRRSNGSRQKIVVAGAANWRASWMPDGQSFAFISVRDPEKNPDDVAVYRIRADGSGGAELLHRQRYGVWEAEVSRDGRWMVVRTDEDNGSSLRARRLNGDTTLVPIRVGEGVTLQAALSPDGRWLAYVSNESGQYEIYVASFPDMTSKRLVSRGGGTEPRWARNGRELYFKSGGQLVTVSLAAGRSFTPGNPQPLFPLAGFREARNHPQYDVAADGRFVMIRESSAGSGVVYAERWLDELRTKLKH